MAHMLMIPRRVVPKTVREMVVGAALETCRSQGEPSSFGGPAIRKRWYVLKPRVPACSLCPGTSSLSSLPRASKKMTLLVAGLAVAEKWSRQWSDNQSTELGAGAFEDDTGPRKDFHKAPSPGSARTSCWPGRAPDIGLNPRPQS